jgi:hypothetical protein
MESICLEKHYHSFKLKLIQRSVCLLTSYVIVIYLAMEMTKDLETTWWVNKDNAKPWLETEEFHYIWLAMTANLMGKIYVAAHQAVLDKILKHAKSQNKDVTIGGIMNTGVHWVLWTYSEVDGMTIYDPYKHGSHSSHVATMARNKGLQVVIVRTGQQHNEDGWSCGYHVLFWVLLSAMRAVQKYDFAWVRTIVLSKPSTQWVAVLVRLVGIFKKSTIRYNSGLQ